VIWSAPWDYLVIFFAGYGVASLLHVFYRIIWPLARLWWIGRRRRQPSMIVPCGWQSDVSHRQMRRGWCVHGHCNKDGPCEGYTGP
jgi:hypothetical protein